MDPRYFYATMEKMTESPSSWSLGPLPDVRTNTSGTSMEHVYTYSSRSPERRNNVSTLMHWMPVDT